MYWNGSQNDFVGHELIVTTLAGLGGSTALMTAQGMPPDFIVPAAWQWTALEIFLWRIWAAKRFGKLHRRESSPLLREWVELSEQPTHRQYARFHGPYGVAIDAHDNLYVTDIGNNEIRKITSAAVVSVMAGSTGGAGSANGTGVGARFNNPAGITVDSAGNLYVADTGNSMIRQITPAGSVITIAGLAINAGSADGAGSNARFSSPRGIVLDGGGNLYVPTPATTQFDESLRQVR
ncbi:MAG: hypothetical protein WDM76_18340 [Limisphaerales bacterium]